MAQIKVGECIAFEVTTTCPENQNINIIKFALVESVSLSWLTLKGTTLVLDPSAEPGSLWQGMRALKKDNRGPRQIKIEQFRFKIAVINVSIFNDGCLMYFKGMSRIYFTLDLARSSISMGLQQGC